MTKSLTERTRTVRARHTKSRNGCLTCRIRRIRCDETLPFCHNCSSTGRQCEGPKEEKFTFVPGRQASSRRQVSPGNSRSSSDASQPRICIPLAFDNHALDERRSFDFFVRRTAPLFAAGALNSAFWRKLVPQVCHSDTVVWNAAITIGILTEHPIAKNHVVYRNGTGKPTKSEQLQALKWYSRAVSGVKQRMADENGMASALLTCILFACIEIQQGNTNNGLNLVRHGVKLFADYLKVAPKDRPPGYRILDEVVIPFFSQQAIFLATFGLPLLSQAAQAAELPPPSSQEQAAGSWSSEELRLQLYRLMYLSHELIRGAMLILEDARTIEIFTPRQISILAELQQWRARFDASIKKRFAPGTDWACSFLLMHYHVAYIWVSIALSPEEGATDQHTDRFRDVVDHAEKYLLLRPAEGPDSSLFEFGAEAIPPLYFTVTKCRHPEIRRKALSLIDHLPKTDTIWATLPVVQILGSLIAFEEKTNATAADKGHHFPAEEDRVHHVQLFKTAASTNLAARFVTFSRDDGGRRKLKENVVSLDDWKNMPGNETRRRFPSHFRLPGDATSLRLSMSPDFLSMMSPSHIVDPTPQISVESVV